MPDPLPLQDRTSALKAARPIVTRAEIAATLGYIQRHACDGVSPATVVKETQSVPLGTFSRHFRAATGLTLRGALRQRQVEEARRMLLRTELSPQYIAEYCSFRDVHAAARAFLAAGSEVPHALLTPKEEA
ncbi:AraC family transcriptional regulator [Haloferula sp. BvORR071]|uniref:helix-turn-helix transcriptional regulator n=1 Tax=Haloferula sp. BvORR071 TaxID=1396141 RepID=UPI002240F714|nr:AraC family transcriptional regulator [Haloferula sp. BvORR071]